MTRHCFSFPLLPLQSPSFSHRRCRLRSISETLSIFIVLPRDVIHLLLRRHQALLGLLVVDDIPDRLEVLVVSKPPTKEHVKRGF